MRLFRKKPEPDLTLCPYHKCRTYLADWNNFEVYRVCMDERHGEEKAIRSITSPYPYRTLIIQGGYKRLCPEHAYWRDLNGYHACTLNLDPSLVYKM